MRQNRGSHVFIHVDLPTFCTSLLANIALYRVALNIATVPCSQRVCSVK